MLQAESHKRRDDEHYEFFYNNEVHYLFFHISLLVVSKTSFIRWLKIIVCSIQ